MRGWAMGAALAVAAGPGGGAARADEPGVQPAAGGAPSPLESVQPSPRAPGDEGAVASGGVVERARAHGRRYVAAPVLVVASLGVGVEENERASWPGGGGAGEVTHAAPVAFHVSGAALWGGLVGPSLGLYASEGAPVVIAADRSGARQPGLGDRLSLALAVAVRPLAPIAWRRGDDYLGRLAAGVGLELGASIETVRTSLDSGTGAALHALLSTEIPLSGGASVGGVTLRLAVRLVVGARQQLARDPTAGTFAVDQPGVAAQLFAGFAYYL